MRFQQREGPVDLYKGSFLNIMKISRNFLESSGSDIWCDLSCRSAAGGGPRHLRSNLLTHNAAPDPGPAQADGAASVHCPDTDESNCPLKGGGINITKLFYDSLLDHFNPYCKYFCAGDPKYFYS